MKLAVILMCVCALNMIEVKCQLDGTMMQYMMMNNLFGGRGSAETGAGSTRATGQTGGTTAGASSGMDFMGLSSGGGMGGMGGMMPFMMTGGGENLMAMMMCGRMHGYMRLMCYQNMA